MDKQRLAAARRLGRELPKIAKANTGEKIFVFLDSDTMPHVMGRLVQDVPNARTATVAVYWPETETLEIVTFGQTPTSGDAYELGEGTTIGMLVDSARSNDGGLTFKTAGILGGGTQSVSAPLVYA